jgi:hypothetical protein
MKLCSSFGHAEMGLVEIPPLDDSLAGYSKLVRALFMLHTGP